MSTSERRSAAYEACVARYLASPLGRSTPDSVATKLMAVSPESLGMARLPSVPSLHSLRAYLEAWELEDGPDLRGAEVGNVS